MITVDLGSETERRLESFASRSGKTKDSCIREIIKEYLADLDDAHVDLQRLKEPEKTYSAEEVKRELGISL